MFYSGEFHPFRSEWSAICLFLIAELVKGFPYQVYGLMSSRRSVLWAIPASHSMSTGLCLKETQEHSLRKVSSILIPSSKLLPKQAFTCWHDRDRKVTRIPIAALSANLSSYINAEASGGGFPGWLQRIKGLLRTPAPDYLNATNLYVASVSAIIAKAQITNDGPVILLQPENEYSGAEPGVTFPDAAYMQYVEDQYRNGGIIVPLLSNDAYPGGHNAPGQPAPVDIYGHDGYPLGFDCANPYTWPDDALPTNWHILHEEQSPTTPYSITEFQGGSFDPWGGLGFAQCEILLNEQFERVFYKNDFSFGVTIFNIYMTFGGTNWGNLGHPGGYTSCKLYTR